MSYEAADADHYTGLPENGVPHDSTATVTLTRTRVVTANPSDPFEAITVVLALTGGQEPDILDALDEAGEPLELNPHESLLARCLANAGVDETGR